MTLAFLELTKNRKQNLFTEPDPKMGWGPGECLKYMRFFEYTQLKDAHAMKTYCPVHTMTLF